MKYDFIIVGAGVAGVYAAYEFMVKKPGSKILMIEKGRSIYERKCPVNEHKIAKCPIFDGVSGCKPSCSITNGFGGFYLLYQPLLTRKSLRYGKRCIYRIGFIVSGIKYSFDNQCLGRLIRH
mgnify:CR=1 FL=1